MTNYYSDKKTSAKSYIRAVAVFLILSCLPTVASADAGYFTYGAWDINISTDGTYNGFVYNTSTSTQCRFAGADATGVAAVDLGEISYLNLNSVYVNTWANSTATTDFQVHFGIGSTWVAYDMSSNCISDNNTEWIYSPSSTLDLINYFVSAGAITTEGASDTLQVYIDGSFGGTTQYLSNTNGGNYLFTFTYKAPSEVALTASFGNVAYGESKAVTLDLSSYGLSAAPEASNSWPAYYTLTSSSTDAVTITFTPNEDCINQGTEALGATTLYLTSGAYTFAVSPVASSFTPLIVSTGYDTETLGYSSVDLTAQILYFGCNAITEYGVYYSTSSTFDESTWTKLVVETDVSISEGSYTLQKGAISGLMSGTTYYYKWYMINSAGTVTYEDDVNSVTTATGNYRIVVRDESTSVVEYLGLVFDPTQETAYTTYFVPCDGTYTYALRYYNSETSAWQTVTSGTIRANSTSTSSTSYAQSYVEFSCSGLSSVSTATVTLSKVSPDYNYVVYFVDSDGNKVTTSDGTAVSLKAEGTAAATDFVYGYNQDITSLASGVTYEVYRKCTNTAIYADSCLIGSGDAEYTGTLTNGTVVTVSYTGGSTYPVFTTRTTYWVYTNTSATGTSMTDANTMDYVECTDGTQGASNGQYCLLFEIGKPSSSYNIAPFEVRDPEGSTVSTYSTQFSVNDSHEYAYARYMYNEETGVSYLDYMYGDSSAPELYLGLQDADGNVTYVDFPLVEGSDYIYRVEELELTGYVAANVYSVYPWATGSKNNTVWYSGGVTFSNIDKSDVEYDLKANCLNVTAYGLTFNKIYDGSSIQVADDGTVTIELINNSESTVAAADYYITLKDGTKNLYLSGTNSAIPAGETLTRTASSKIENVSDYNITASLTWNTLLQDTDTLTVCTPTTFTDTVFYTINYELADNECKYQFTTIEKAISHLKDNSDAMDLSTGNLIMPVVFNVFGESDSTNTYMGTVTTNVTGGEVVGYVNMISEINNGTEPDGGYKKLIIRNGAGDKNVSKPSVGHIVIRNSKAIELQYLYLVGTRGSSATSSYTNAIDIDDGSSNWTEGAVGRVTNSDISIKHCDIVSYGFTCIHASGIDDLEFEDNTIVAHLKDISNIENVVNWGASVKFIRCENVKFTRNTFTGEHVTNVWLQECNSVLVMNNVFWTDNTFDVSTANGNTCATIRLMCQKSGYPTSNIGIYYNTMFVSEKSVNDIHNYLQFGGNASEQDQNTDVYTPVHFMYNNCYAYGSQPNQRTSDPLWESSSAPSKGNTIMYNNFWSDYDDSKSATSSVFAIGSEYSYVPVRENLCSTSTDSPESLVIKGDKLNLGSKIATDISGLGADNTYSDRISDEAVRPSEGTGWTYGAYQQSTTSRSTIGTIVWNGGGSENTNWDYRGNWVTTSGRTIDCMDTFADTLRVILPAPNSENYYIPSEGISSYPAMPLSFDDESVRTYKEYNEQVDAGAGVLETTIKFFGNVYMEPGATLANSYLLYQDGETRRYNSVTAVYQGERSKWLMTGNMVKPFTDKNENAVRNVVSGDYYMNFEPWVYMREAEVDATTGEVSWNQSFASMSVEVKEDQQFAVNFPDQYGSYGLSAARYASFTGNSAWASMGTEPVTLQFKGWFASEQSLPKYTIASDGYTLLNNYLPANLDAYLVKTLANLADLKYYDSESGSFVSLDETAATGDVLIRPRSGFVVKSNADSTQLSITTYMLETSAAANTRSIAQTYPYVKIASKKKDTNWGSQSKITVNQNVNESNRSEYAIDKLFNATTDMAYVPEVYIIQDGKNYENVTIPSVEYVVPLGLRVREKMDVTIGVTESDGINVCILEDREAGVFYDVLNFKAWLRSLAADDYQGRYYLHLSKTSDGEEEEEGDDDGGSNPTDIDESSTAQGITIYNKKGKITVSTDNVNLSKIYVTDTAGIVSEYKAAGTTTVLDLDLTPGVYIVSAIGDVMSSTQKIIVQ